MSVEARMLLNMPMSEAKALRMKYGDAKYGYMRPVSFLLEAYVEAVDIDNYADLALQRGEINVTQHDELRARVTSVLSLLRRLVPKDA